MTTCARCGLPSFDINTVSDKGQCWGADNGLGTIACRDRELSSLRALLRAQTRKLENAAELCHYNGSAGRIEALINEVLEALS